MESNIQHPTSNESDFKSTEYINRPGPDCGPHLRLRCGDAVTNADTYPRCHRNTHGHAHSYRDANPMPNGDTHAHPYRDANSDPNGDIHTNQHCHLDGHAHPHLHLDSNSDPDCHANTHPYAHSHAPDHRPISRGSPH